MASNKRSVRGKQTLWKGWTLKCWKHNGYQILSLVRPKHTPIYSILSSPNVIRLAFKKGSK